MEVQQKSFDGGMNLILADTQVPENAYVRLLNGRQRLSYIEPNHAHRLLTTPEGKKQGIASVGSVLIVFIAGLAYYQQDGSSAWIQVPSFSMDVLVDRYYTQAVPASTMNFVRRSTAAGYTAPLVVSSNFSVSGTPQCLVVQDTINQPWLIFLDEVNSVLTARVSKTYAQWANVSTTANDREYVPIGRQMMFLNQSLYVVSRDKKRVYRSVTGRPLDFVIAVDINGNKLPSELQGGAEALSFAMDFDDINCLRPVNIPDSFLYGTARNVRIVTLDYTTRIFNEPTFVQSAIIEAGVVNNDSVAEILGDYAFVDYENVKLFNAVLQLRNEGRNSIFSLQLAELLRDIKQVNPQTVVFNNYALFYLKTTMGNTILAYDILRESWVSIDLTTVDQIKQFTLVSTPTATKLYAITNLDEVYQMYDDTQLRENCYLFTRAFATDRFDVQHKSQIVRPVFKAGTVDGTVGIVEYVDDFKGNRIENDLVGVTAGITFSMQFPIIFDSVPQVDNDAWMLKDGRGGHKLSYIIYWNTDAQLKGFIVLTTDVPRDASLEQTNKVYS